MMPAKQINYPKKDISPNTTIRKRLLYVIVSYIPVYIFISVLLSVIGLRLVLDSAVEPEAQALKRPFVIYFHPYVQDFNQYIEAPHNFKLIIPITPDTSPLEAGDCIELTNFELKEDSIFIDRPEYKQIEKCSIPILKSISNLRFKLITDYQSYMKYPYSGIILGVTFGYKDEFTKEFRDAIRSSGLSHIFVVSGYNFSLINVLLRNIFSVLGRFIYFLCLTVILFLYLSITGLNPPAVRAIIMSLMTSIALIQGRKTNSILILIYSGLFMLLINPLYIFDLSFQLSFMATMGLVVSGHITTSKTLRVISEIFFVNLFIFPIIIFYFKQFSLIGIINNILILDLIPVLTMVGFANLFFKDSFTGYFSASIANGIYVTVNMSKGVSDMYPWLMIRAEDGAMAAIIMAAIALASILFILLLKWKYRVQE